MYHKKAFCTIHSHIYIDIPCTQICYKIYRKLDLKNLNYTEIHYSTSGPEIVFVWYMIVIFISYLEKRGYRAAILRHYDIKPLISSYENGNVIIS